ncbi:protein of unknown function [Xenorhabdus doucetiae]|uniref:Uncharacterized protein n=1 Tax=Xenorhabdus doucetiae TaxID=351671 RepID=A0A068QX39_9GAMM|nr:protein of unknown function [Xenorhabdus doucetiae]
MMLPSFQAFSLARQNLKAFMTVRAIGKIVAMLNNPSTEVLQIILFPH